MTQHTTLGVLFRWLYAKHVVAEQMQAARNVVIRQQLMAMRGTFPVAKSLDGWRAA